jgi:NAD(P)-dependent dehydrogenase (short-subunit alcohol dehydrogenase family)
MRARFAGKRVLVTGAARGIGRSIADAYAQEGARVIRVDISPIPDKSDCIRADVSDPEAVTAMVSTALSLCGAIDILINNVGIGCSRSPYELSVEEWDRVINTSLRSVFLCSREVAASMRILGGGSIVNIASTRALMSEPDSEAYAAAKGGVIALTHALAASFSADRIQVNCISPGWIETGAYEELRPEDHRQHPAGRVGLPRDIARACLFLTEAGNDFISGENMVIDGGMTKKMIYEP